MTRFRRIRNLFESKCLEPQRRINIAILIKSEIEKQQIFKKLLEKKIFFEPFLKVHTVLVIMQFFQEGCLTTILDFWTAVLGG